MWGRERGRTDMSPRAWAETNTARQPQGEAVKLVFLYFHVSAVMCCHIRKLCSFFRCALLVSLPMVGVCVCVCVLNLSLSALWSPCPNRFGWSLLVGCVQYLCRAGYMCTRVFVCRADAPKAQPLLSIHTHTHSIKEDYLALYLFICFLNCPHPTPKAPPPPSHFS